MKKKKREDEYRAKKFYQLIKHKFLISELIDKFYYPPSPFFSIVIIIIKIIEEKKGNWRSEECRYIKLFEKKNEIKGRVMIINKYFSNVFINFFFFCQSTCEQFSIIETRIESISYTWVVVYHVNPLSFRNFASKTFQRCYTRRINKWVET